jgi:hypothetical protein
VPLEDKGFLGGFLVDLRGDGGASRDGDIGRLD